jgi:hypothetical protein
MIEYVSVALGIPGVPVCLMKPVGALRGEVKIRCGQCTESGRPPTFLAVTAGTSYLGRCPSDGSGVGLQIPTILTYMHRPAGGALPDY